MLKDSDIAVLEDIRKVYSVCLNLIATHGLLDEFIAEMDKLKIKPGVDTRLRDLIERQQGE